MNLSAFTAVEQKKISEYERTRLFSLFWEVRALLYLGVLFLSAGLGILVYKNIDTIGHEAILIFMGMLALVCLTYCFRKAPPFSPGPTVFDSSWTDYILLLSVLLIGILVGYSQFTYSIFGRRYGLALGLPALVYLLLAYRFDHRGVLQLALSGIAAAFGIAVSPISMVQDFNLSHPLPSYTGLAVSVAFGAASLISEHKDFKSHFSFSFLNFSMHLAFAACLSGMFSQGNLLSWSFTILLALLAGGFWKYGQHKQSPYFLLCSVVYGYIGLTYTFLHFLFKTTAATTATIYLALLYFILSCVGTIYFFLNLKSFLDSDDSSL